MFHLRSRVIWSKKINNIAYNFFYFFSFQFQIISRKLKHKHTVKIMVGRLFRAHGEFCASHPWEVIVALLTLTACMLTVDKNTAAEPTTPTSSSARHRHCQGWRESCDGFEAEYNALDVILMTIVRCSAVLYSYYQFLNLHKFGSKYILGECLLSI